MLKPSGGFLKKIFGGGGAKPVQKKKPMAPAPDTKMMKAQQPVFGKSRKAY